MAYSNSGKNGEGSRVGALRSAIQAAQSEGASDDEVLRMISVATLLAARDAGITGEIEAFVASKKAKEECEA